MSFEVSSHLGKQMVVSDWDRAQNKCKFTVVARRSDLARQAKKIVIHWEEVELSKIDSIDAYVCHLTPLR